jgi:hypothetical protein
MLRRAKATAGLSSNTAESLAKFSAKGPNSPGLSLSEPHGQQGEEPD